MKKTIIVTAFEPFNNRAENASYIAVKNANLINENYNVIKLFLPVNYDSCFDLLKSLILKENTVGVICFGEAGKRTTITPEVVALNYKDASIADNLGVFESFKSINDNCPLAYKSTLPLIEIVDNLKAKQIPTTLSYHAGTYVCNNLFFLLMAFIKENNPKLKGGFIHLPYVLSQVNNVGLSQTQLVSGVETILQTLIDCFNCDC